MKLIIKVLLPISILLIGLNSCEEDDSATPDEAQSTNTQNMDTTQSPVGSQFWLDDGSVKCSPEFMNFNTVLKQVNINSKKCYQELVRPNISFYFHTGTFGVGNFTMVDKFQLSSNEVNLSISGYNNKTYKGINGMVSVSKNQQDSLKWDIDFNKLQLFSTTDSMNHTFTGRVEAIGA